MGAVPSSSSKSAPKLTSSLQFRRYLLTGPHGAVQCATKDSGKAQLEGEFKAMSELFKTMPTLVPRPFAWGKLQLQSPPTYFFLCEFVNISDSLPDPVKLGKCLAELHKESVSPTGQFGFYVPTYDGRLPQITDWESSWTLFFGRLLAGIYQLDIDTNGTWKELDDMMDQTLRHVIPRLLGALESNGRTVKPCLIHGDLWEGNIGTDFETGNLYIFDSCAYYAHNEMEIGMWRVDHHRLKAKAYRQEYIRNVEPSEPAEEWDDRNRLYSVKTKLMYSAHVPGSKVRKQ
jgi:protein-ribulosamine 3-kinase